MKILTGRIAVLMGVLLSACVVAQPTETPVATQPPAATEPVATATAPSLPTPTRIVEKPQGLLVVVIEDPCIIVYNSADEFAEQCVPYGKEMRLFLPIYNIDVNGNRNTLGWCSVIESREAYVQCSGLQLVTEEE